MEGFERVLSNHPPALPGDGYSTLSILLVPMKPTDRPRTEKGVTYCGSQFEAQLAAASMLPSKLATRVRSTT